MMSNTYPNMKEYLGKGGPPQYTPAPPPRASFPS